MYLIFRVTAMNVGEALLNQTAILLPEVYNNFTSKVYSVLEEYKLQNEPNQCLPKNIWLRNQLSSLLEHHMAYKCSLPKYGTVLYRYGGDLIHALTMAPKQANQKIDDGSMCMITQACKALNQKLHTEVNKVIEKESVNSEHFNIQKFVESVDPTLWKALCLLTDSKSKKVTHTREIRRAYTFCQLLGNSTRMST